MHEQKCQTKERDEMMDKRSSIMHSSKEQRSCSDAVAKMAVELKSC